MAARGITFSRYFKTVNRKVYESILDTVEHPSIENFHRLRINIKRIRFILRLIRRFRVKGVSRFGNPYTKLFKAAGKIRELHLHAQLVSAYGKKGEKDRVLQYFQKKEANAVKKWPGKASTCLAEMISCQTGFEHAIANVVLTVAAYSNDLKRRVSNRFIDTLPDDRLHKSRRLLKEIVYSREVSSALNARMASTYHIRTVLTLEDAIGDWHDLDLLLMNGLPHQHSLTKRMRKELEVKRNQEYKKIRNRIPHIMK